MKSDNLDKNAISEKEATKTNLHKLDKRHNPDKCQPLPKRPRYERYKSLTTNHTTILEEASTWRNSVDHPRGNLLGQG